MPNNATDPRITTDAERDLLRSLADEIVEKEVIQPMEKIGWGHGTPPPAEPEAAKETTPEAAKVEATPEAREPVKAETGTTPEAKPAEKPEATVVPATEIDWESLREANGKILGKYNTPAEATKGVRHAVEMAKTAFNREKAANERAEALQKQLNERTVTPAPVVTAPVKEESKVVVPSDLDKVFEDIIEDGGTLDADNTKRLREALQTQAEAIAKNVVEHTLKTREEKVTAENEKWVKVDQYMRQNHPESLNFTDEISVFVQANALVGAAVQALIATGNEVKASELAWVEYKRAADMEIAQAKSQADQKTEITLEAAEEVRKAAVEKAQKDAGIMTTMAQGVHEVPNAGVSQEEIDAAAAEMRTTGLGERWRRLAFSQYLNDPVFDQ